VVSAERGGGEHRFEHGIYAGSLGLGISYSCDMNSWVRATIAGLQRASSESLTSSLMSIGLGMTGTYREIG